MSSDKLWSTKLEMVQALETLQNLSKGRLEVTTESKLTFEDRQKLAYSGIILSWDEEDPLRYQIQIQESVKFVTFVHRIFRDFKEILRSPSQSKREGRMLEVRYTYQSLGLESFLEFMYFIIPILQQKGLKGRIEEDSFYVSYP
jgi:hypothetical protein